MSGSENQHQQSLLQPQLLQSSQVYCATLLSVSLYFQGILKCPIFLKEHFCCCSCYLFVFLRICQVRQCDYPHLQSKDKKQMW